MIWEELERPFPFSEIEVKVQTFNKDMTKALTIAYFDARAVRRRLNEVCGRDGWYPEYRVDAKGVICRLTIKAELWRSFEDGADFTDIASYKGGISDAFKRAFAGACNDSLHSVDLGWQEIETYTDGKGNQKFKCFTRAAMKTMEKLYNDQTGFKPDFVNSRTEPNETEQQTAKRIVSEMQLTKPEFDNFKTVVTSQNRKWMSVLFCAHEDGCTNYDRLMEYVESTKEKIA